MKIRNTRTAESTFGEEFESKEFTANVSGKFFDIVLDKIYTNKPRSIERELWTNAFDSHIANGNPERPFFCQLPTPLDQSFTVRDYGTGMTHEFVMDRYSRIFDSTRTDGEDADEFVGAFGLGSKSPFAYTDSFTVRVWLNGEERTYLASRAADGIPSITHLSTVPSDEEQGVEVSFPVQAEDFYRFRHEAEIVAEGFDVKPEIPGLQLRVAPALFEGENWRVMEQRSDAIRQGCVIYPVHDLEIETGLGYAFSLVVDVPVGQVEVAANREALSLDPETTAHVLEAFASASKELEAKVTEYILDAPDLFDANVRWQQMDRFFVNLEGITYHGQPLDGTITFLRQEVNTTPQHVTNSKEKEVFTGKLLFPVAQADSLAFVIDRTGNSVPRKKIRLRTWVKGAHGRKIYVLKDPTSRQLAALVRRLHLRADQIIGIASLPDVEIKRSPRQARGRNAQGVYDLVTLSPIREMADEYYFVEIPRVDGRDWHNVGQDVSTSWDAASVQSELCKAWQLLDDGKPVYAMTPSAVKRIKPKHSLTKAVKAHVAANRRQIARRVKVRTAVDFVRINAMRIKYRHLSDEIVNRMLVRLVPNATEFAPTYGDVLDKLFAQLDRDAYDKAVADGEAYAAKVAERYPLLFETTEDDILRYVNSNPRRRKS